MPGVEKMILTPTDCNASPSQPRRPYSNVSASPTTTGETANGRSMNASRSRRPRILLRTRTSAVTTPNTALRGTAIAVTVTVSQNAWIAAGVVMLSQTAPRPGWNVL